MAVPGQKKPATNTKSAAGGEDKVPKLVAAAPANLKTVAQKNIPIIYKECIKNGVTDPGQIAYVLATAEHESHLGKMMMERQWIKNEEENNKYFTERYGSRKDLGNIDPSDGPKYKGRGFCQITGRVNYNYWTNKLGINLLENPDLAASDISVAARILVVGMKEGSFTKKHKLSDHISGSKRDFMNPKNPKDDAEKKKATKEIEAMANRYYTALTS